MKKDILFLCQFFYPEYNSSATLPFDTAKFLASQGYSVGALVGYPKEYSVDKNLSTEETVDGVHIKRIKYLQLNRVGVISRLINYFSFTFGAFLKRSYLKNYRIVVVYSNPPILPIIPILAKKKYGTKFVFVAYDIYPEVAYASRLLTPDSVISRFMNWINRRLYQSVDSVVSLTDEMKEFLLANRKELTRDRVTTIPNWAHEKESEVSCKAYERFGYKENQFIVSYFGNMGTCQDVDTMMEVASLLRGDDRVRFLVAGHGNKKDAVAAMIKDNQLNNVQLCSFLLDEEFQQALQISSCCIVSLEKGLIGMCAPSKYYSYLQVGKPVLSVVEAESYLAKEVREQGIGYTVEIGDTNALKNAIIDMVENPEKTVQMGQKAKELYKESYAYEVAMKKYGELISKLIS